MVCRCQEREGKEYVGRYRWLHVAVSLRPRVHVGRELKLRTRRHLVLALYRWQHAEKWRQLKRHAGQRYERNKVRGRLSNRSVTARAGSVASQGVFQLWPAVL